MGFLDSPSQRIPLPERWNQHLEIHGAPTMCHDEPPAIDHRPADWRLRPAVRNFLVSMESKGGKLFMSLDIVGDLGQEIKIEILNHYFEMWKYYKEVMRNIPTESSCGENCCLNHPIRSLNKSRQGLWYDNFALSITWRRGDRVQIPSYFPTNPQGIPWNPPGTTASWDPPATPLPHPLLQPKPPAAPKRAAPEHRSAAAEDPLPWCRAKGLREAETTWRGWASDVEKSCFDERLYGYWKPVLNKNNLMAGVVRKICSRFLWPQNTYLIFLYHFGKGQMY